MISTNDIKLQALTLARRTLNARAFSLFCLAAAIAPIGCGASAPGEAEEASLGEAEEQIVTTPATCLEIKNGTPGAADGDYVLYVGHSAGKPFKVYCKDMATTPAEYLSLPNTGGNFNYSQETVGDAISGTNVRTTFTRVRLDPVNMVIKVTDRTFATSTGLVDGWNQTTMDYAAAASCQWGPAGLGNVDLRGTAFSVLPNEFVTDGWYPTGGATYSAGNQVVDLTGGGYCGGTTSHPTADGFQLHLAYHPLPVTCQEIKTSAAGPLADGEYVLYAGSDPRKPFKVYCKDMAGLPTEYVTLPNTGGNFNYSQETVGDAIPGTNVRTTFTKVRIDPSNLVVKVTDRTFATSTGLVNGWNLTTMDYAAAASCQWGPAGLGNVDLRGTTFSVLPNEFVTDGWYPTGGATYSAGNQVVDLTGGGYCGGTTSHPTTDGFQLHLGLQRSTGDATTISQGWYDACAIQPNGTVKCWGMNANYTTPASPSGAFAQVDSGEDGSCGLRDDGTIACWGPIWHFYDSPPSGKFTQMVLGSRHGCALKSDGTVACWGDNRWGQASPPAGTFIGLSSGFDVTCGVRSDQTLACWGENGTYNFQITSPPAGAYTQVSVGRWHACAIKQSDSTVACWGMYGTAKAPPGVAFKRIAAGGGPDYDYAFTCGIKMDDTVACWIGASTSTWPIPGTYSQIAARYGAVGVHPDGTLTSFYSLYSPDPLQPVPAGLLARTE